MMCTIIFQFKARFWPFTFMKGKKQNLSRSEKADFCTRRERKKRIKKHSLIQFLYYLLNKHKKIQKTTSKSLPCIG